VIFTKFGAGEGVPGPYPHAKLHRCDFKNVGLHLPKSPKLVIFAINLPQRGIPLKWLFYQIWLGEGVWGPHPHAKLHHCGLENVGLQPSKSRKMEFLV